MGLLVVQEAELIILNIFARFLADLTRPNHAPLESDPNGYTLPLLQRHLLRSFTILLWPHVHRTSSNVHGLSDGRPTDVVRGTSVGRPLDVCYCEYLGSSGGYGSSGGVPEVRESGIWKFGGGVRKFGSLLFFNHFKKFAPEGQIF